MSDIKLYFVSAQWGHDIYFGHCALVGIGQTPDKVIRIIHMRNGAVLEGEEFGRLILEAMDDENRAALMARLIEIEIP